MQYDPKQGLARIRAAPSIVLGQLGQTLDGRVATVTGESLYINGRCALTHLHALRAAVDAVIVGVGTVTLDNPRLSVRLVEGQTPTRVILDPHGRVPAESQCFHDDQGPVIVIHGAGIQSVSMLPTSADLLPLPCDSKGRIAPDAIVRALQSRGLRRLLVEGGPDTLSRAVDAGIVDELHIMVAPKLIGSGKIGFSLAPIEKLSDALCPSAQTHIFDDGDVLFACNLREKRDVVAGLP